jgi:phosphoenolpyruvate-protein kinase (PTS system EI component)
VVAPVREIAVLANINRAEDVEEAVRVQAEGIGLYRTEFECMAAGRFLGEEEQESRFRAILKAMAGRPVYVRLYDLGGDKRPDFLGLPVELNPSLGLRGARLLLARPDWVAAQARAVARASQHGPVHLTYPMITDAAQFLALRRLVEEAMAGIRTGTILHGAMFEVPGACLQAAEILGVADFGSIGTNDLYQYLFAVDRNSEYVSDDFRPDTPVFWSLIRGVLEAGVRERKPVSVCGEIAGWSKYVERLLGIGTHTVSVSTRVIGSVRRAAQSAGARREAQAHA